MNTTKQTLQIFLLIGIILNGACRKAPISQTVAVPGQVYSYFNLPYTKTNGQFLIANYALGNDSSEKKSATIQGNFYNTEKDSIYLGGPVNIAGYHILPTGGNYQLYSLPFDSLFGRNVTLNITPPINMSTMPLTATFYFPAPIYVTNVKPRATVNIERNAAMPVSWGVDPNNTNGVNIKVEYSPSLSLNDSLRSLGDSALLTNSIVVPDNGSTVLPPDFFAKFPTGANLWVYVSRGNAMILQSGQYKFLLEEFFGTIFFAVKK